MKFKSVLQVIDTLNVGGAERVFIDMSNLLSDSGVDVTALFLLNSGPMSDKLRSGIRKIELQRGTKLDPKAFTLAAHLMKQFKITHCHSRHVYRYMKLVQRMLGVRTEVILHDHFGSIGVDQSVPKMMKGFLRPTSYIGVSADLTKWAKDNLTLHESRVHLLENVIIRKEGVEKDSERNGMVLVSNIKPLKNQLFAIENLTGNGEPLTIIGKSQNDEYFRECSEAAGNRSDIEFLSDVDEVQELLPRFKIGLHTSKSETGPLVLIEYLAQGLPFLAYETGEVAYLLKKEFPKFFLTTFDSNAWNDRLDELLSIEPDIEKMNAVFTKQFSSKGYVNKCLEIYENINN